MAAAKKGGGISVRQTPGNKVISYNTMRKLIGVLGIALPIVLWLGGALFKRLPLQSSISAYYYTNMQDALTGILCAVAMFLFCYRGDVSRETIFTNVAAGGALGVALFPCGLASPTEIFQLPGQASLLLHVVFAGVFFLSLAYISYVIFAADAKEPEKTLYKVCAIVIAAALVLIMVVKLVMYLFYKGRPEPTLVFIFESVALWAFGISWLVKGELVAATQRVLVSFGGPAPAPVRAGPKGRGR